ncbi:16S rRNA (cytosine(967)-C(5))-methyltransferase RsmB [Fusobacterium sp. PH5-44]|uniref:16S rRNA (cytosine(967)-C(5))-methyltransferase RsmB n=1 Tax=unclassified Fusobacterium TaxID=2648384 RepID=UPI003D2279CA
MSIKFKIIPIIQEVLEGKFSNIVLNKFFSENNFIEKERNFITEIFYGVIRKKIFLDYMIDSKVKSIKKEWIRNLLRISIYQITFMNSDDKGVVWEGTEIGKKKFGVAIGKFINGVLRSYIREKDELIDKLKKEREDIYLSYPKWFYEKIKNEYPDEYVKILESLKKIPYISFRVNKLKYTEKEFEKLLKSKDISIIKKIDGVYYISAGSLIYSDEFKEGKIIIQDASSYIAAKNLVPLPNESVLDACAAPGGKTAVIAEFMENNGEIVSLDVYPHKIKLIEENNKKLGITISKAVNLDARKINMQGKKFDKILIDAPCSGYGVLRKKPETIYRKKMENIENLSKLQLEILESVSEVLKDNGILIYSTCTILKEENTANIEKFLEKNPKFSIEKLEIPENINGFYDKYGGFQIDYSEEILDGFYFIKLKKNI